MTVARQVNAALSDDRLEEAIRLAVEGARNAPQDVGLRMLLIEVLILSGDYERADRQADVASKISPADAVGLGILRGQIRGMDARAQWFRNGAVPSFPGGPTAADEAGLRLNLALRENDAAGARAASDALEAAIQPSALSWNGCFAPDLRDADDRLPHAFEAITTGGSYLWVDMSRIASIALEPVKRPLDLAFRRATVALKSGSEAQLLLPSVYGPVDDVADALKLGRQTDWIDLPGGLTGGQGMRCFLVGEELEPFAAAETIETIRENVLG
jgi:type VI secretion system protein ImpE